jgi:NADH-quinone oxidoreductase subunit L
MRVTFITYAVGMMALSGVPLFFSGAWTKEEILQATSLWPPSHVPYSLLMAGVVLTALYMTRQILFVFFGRPRCASGQAKESPPVMTLPLIVLAICTIAFSVVLTPAWPWLHGVFSGETAAVDLNKIIQPALFISLLLVGAGIALGWLLYRHAGETDPFAQSQPALFRVLANKFWIDEVYSHTVIAFSKNSARLSDWLDRHVWDALVRAVGGLGQLLGIFTTGVDERGINAGVDEGMTGARFSGRFISNWHSGQIQTYLGAIALGMVALLILYAWLG